jgi:signal transduction histidine kinase
MEGDGPIGIDMVGYFDEDGNPMSEADVDALFSEVFGSIGDGGEIISGGAIIPGEDEFSFDVIPGSGDLVLIPGDPSIGIDPGEIPPVTEIGNSTDRITLGVPVEIGDHTLIFAVSRSLHPVAVNLETITGALWWAIPLLILLVGLVTWIVVGRTLRPVQQMATDVDRFSSTQLSSRVSVPDNDDEIAHMARTVNGMLDRIEASVIRQRQFVSDASHELRSPIATIGAEMEVAKAHPETTDWERASDVVLAEQRRLGALVDDLLLLSRFEEGATRDAVEVDLDDIVFTEIRRSRPVSIEGRRVDAVRVEGDRHLLSRLVGNLLSNAQRHAVSEIRVSLTRNAGDVVLTVEDDGPGVPEEERDRIFERFARTEEGRSRDSGGAGLGLAIVREVAVAHGGTVAVEDGSLGGARFVVTLPAPSTPV